MAFRARIGISCARYLYSVIESTPSPWESGSRIESTPSLWDSGSRIDTPSQNVVNYCIGQLSSWVQVGRSHDTVMGRRVVLGEIVTEVSAAGFPINKKLTFPSAVLNPIEVHIDGFGYFCFMVPFAKTSVVQLLTQIGVGGCGCPSSWRVVRIGTASWPM